MEQIYFLLYKQVGSCIVDTKYNKGDCDWKTKGKIQPLLDKGTDCLGRR